MAETSPTPPDGDDREIGDAESLFREGTAKPSPSGPTPQASPSAEEGYELAWEDPPVEEPPVSPVAPPVRRPKPAAEARPRAEAEKPARSTPERPATVDQVWSRGAEWGPNLILLGLVGLGFAFLVYKTFRVDDMTLGLLLIMLAGVVMLLLSYPIVITLERPVRITPEQAVKDFYAALSHHVPHYRRMWLLLSDAGRLSPSYASFEGFKNYWKARLHQLRGDRAGGFTPLVFRIDDFKSEKSAGKTSLEAKFTVNVFLRGKQDEGPVESVRVELGLVKGPDQMWYLNKGTLPGGRA